VYYKSVSAIAGGGKTAVLLNTFSKGLARCSGSNWVFFPDPNWLCAPGANKTYQNGGMSMYPRTIIDSLPAVPNRDQLTHKDLHAHFSTGQSILLSGSGRDKKYGYRNGIQTDLGDIRNDVWRDLVRELIVRSHEEDLFDKLLEWEKEHTYWLKTKAELEHYTLELYAARIFDNPKWVDYEAFAKHYGYQPQSYEG
jgi:hypothetical protein